MEQNRETRNRATQTYPGDFDTGAETIELRKESLFHKWYWSKWTSIGEKKNVSLSHTIYTKIDSKCGFKLKSKSNVKQ